MRSARRAVAFAVLMTREERDNLRALAKREGLSLANLMRRCLNDYLMELGDEHMPLLQEMKHGPPKGTPRPKTRKTPR